MNEAFQPVERLYRSTSLWESYLGSRYACVFNFWLGTLHKANTQHLEVLLHRLPEGGEHPVIPVDPNTFGDIGPRQSEVSLDEHDRLRFAVFVIVGHFA